MIKKLLATIALSFTFVLSIGNANAEIPLASNPKHVSDMASLQNGAKLFVNYCLSCHAAVSMRYNKLTDIGLTEEEITKNLLFTTDKIGDLMEIAMTKEDATRWFGVNPPDLSVIARSRSQTMGASGVDYVYTFLRSFYRDTAETTGWNNLLFPNVGMPNVLWELQGDTKLERTTIKSQDQDDGSVKWVKTVANYDQFGFSDIKSETLASHTGGAVNDIKLTHLNSAQAEAFDNNVADIANFLGWVAEPIQQTRKLVGAIVIAFLLLFLFVAIRLNASYWKHVK